MHNLSTLSGKYFFLLGHRSFIKNRKQTAVIEMLNLHIFIKNFQKDNNNYFFLKIGACVL